MLRIERLAPLGVAPICRVGRLHSKQVEEQIHRWIIGLRLAADIDVAGAEHGIVIRVRTNQTEATRAVHPEDYVNHNNSWARRNPSLAAVMAGLTEILKELGRYNRVKSSARMITWNE